MPSNVKFFGNATNWFHLKELFGEYHNSMRHKFIGKLLHRWEITNTKSLSLGIKKVSAHWVTQKVNTRLVSFKCRISLTLRQKVYKKLIVELQWHCKHQKFDARVRKLPWAQSHENLNPLFF